MNKVKLCKFCKKHGTVYCKIKVPKVAKQKWTLLQVHFGHNCKALYHDSLERCRA